MTFGFISPVSLAALYLNFAERILNQTLLARLTKRKDLQQVMLNSFWLLGDRLLRLGVGFLVSLQVTNYLGTDQYGLMSACMAFAALFSPLTHLGLDSILVRELVSEKHDSRVLLGTGFGIKFMGSSMAMLLGLAAGFFYFQGNTRDLFISFWSLVTFLVLSLDVIDLLYQSQMKSKYTVYAKNASFLIGSGFRLWFLYLQAPLLWFVIVQFAEFALAMCIALFIYWRRGGSIFQWKFSWPLARVLVRESWVVALSGFVILLYMRIDTVMLKSLVGASETGIYNAAVRLSEVWYFVPLAIISSVMPAILKAYNENPELADAKMQRLLDTMTGVALLAGTAVSLTAHYIIKIYKEPFWPAADILVVHIWAGLFVAVGSACSHYLIMKKLSHVNLYRTTAGALANIALNFWLIPLYGGLGAAIATLISYSISDYFSNLFNASTRPLFGMIMQSYNLPRILLQLRKKDTLSSTPNS